MFKLRIYCNDGDLGQYWEDGNGTYETYDKALIACYVSAMDEVSEAMMSKSYFSKNWPEVERDFEITETYETEALKDVAFFPVAAVSYDHAPWDRENDCDIQIVTGYAIVEVKEDNENVF